MAKGCILNTSPWAPEELVPLLINFQGQAGQPAYHGILWRAFAYLIMGPNDPTEENLIWSWLNFPLGSNFLEYHNLSFMRIGYCLPVGLKRVTISPQHNQCPQYMLYKTFHSGNAPILLRVNMNMQPAKFTHYVNGYNQALCQSKKRWTTSKSYHLQSISIVNHLVSNIANSCKSLDGLPTTISTTILLYQYDILWTILRAIVHRVPSTEIQFLS